MKKVKKRKNVSVPPKLIHKPLPSPRSSVREIKGFVCQMCGYEAFKKAGLAHCPLCLICKGCAKKVRYCKCMEGE